MAKDAKGHGSEARDGVSRFAGQGVNYLEPNDPRGASARAAYAAKVSGGAAHQEGVRDATASMTRQHFNLIAQTLAEHGQQVRSDPAVQSALIGKFAEKLAATNPNFSKSHFVAVASGQKPANSRPPRR